MKEQSRKNEAGGLINFEVLIEKSPWKAILATKGSITSKNFEVFLRNLIHR